MKWYVAQVKKYVDATEIGWSDRDDIQVIRGTRTTIGIGAFIHVTQAANGSDWIGVLVNEDRIVRFSKAAACEYLKTSRDEAGRPVPCKRDRADRMWASHKAGVSMSQAYSGE